MDSKILKHKFLRNLYDYGFWISFRRILSYLVKPFYENVLCILYAIDLENFPGNQPSRSGLSFKLVRAEDLSLINGIEKIEEWLKGILEQKLSNNSICLAVLRDEELLGFYLATFGDAIIPLLGLRVIKRPDEAWADQISISGDHRREGLATELKRSMYAELRKRGIKTIYAATRVYNKAALESAHKFGIQKAFIFRYIKFFKY